MAFFSKEQSPPRPPVRSETSAPVAATPGKTYFGPNTTIEGTVAGSEAVLVDGSVRGKINLTGDLHVGVKARIEATVHARNVTVEGKITGDISADDRVELVPTANVDGNIKAPKIIVAEGAKFRGSVDMGSARPKEDQQGENKGR